MSWFANLKTIERGKLRTEEETFELFQYLNETAYRLNKKKTKTSAELIKKMAGQVGEAIIADLVNGDVVEEEGYDVICNIETTLSNGITIRPDEKVEVKTQVASSDYNSTAYSLSNKEGKCDYIALVDMNGKAGKHRISIIPSEEFFSVGHFTLDKNGGKERFNWHSLFETTRASKKADNTKLFLKYEVTYA